MANCIRRPFAIAAALKPLTRPSTGTRFLHQASLKPLAPAGKPKPSPSTFASALARSREAFRRTYIEPASPVQNAGAGGTRQRLLYGAGIFGGTLLAVNLVFNRETREDGGMPPFERAYLNETFLHTGLGIGIIGLVARTLHTSGWSVRLMASKPWLVMGGGLVLSIGTMMGTFATPPEKYGAFSHDPDPTKLTASAATSPSTLSGPASTPPRPPSSPRSSSSSRPSSRAPASTPSP